MQLQMQMFDKNKNYQKIDTITKKIGTILLRDWIAAICVSKCLSWYTIVSQVETDKAVQCNWTSCNS